MTQLRSPLNKSTRSLGRHGNFIARLYYGVHTRCAGLDEDDTTVIILLSLEIPCANQREVRRIGIAALA